MHNDLDSFDEYQVLAHSTSQNTSINGDCVMYPVLGLGDEAGEVLGKFKKLFRDKGGKYTDEFRSDIKKELGDVLWYISEISTQLEIPLSEIAQGNINKLFDRKERNVINGSGDER
jgi:NTP pyrophosphatase (non-canonical NTP hydrolase)